MAVIFKNGQLILRNKQAFESSSKLRLGLSGYSQVLFYSFLFCYPSFTYAGPLDGNIVGGQIAPGSDLLQVNNITNIHQITSSLAIDWGSYNLNANEIVNYIQPGSNSIALNRILGGSASQIHGQINANGNVILVNPNGLFFSPTASINVGGLIASGLDIDPVDFMNGDYIFNEVLGTDGTVINSGLINASLGGNVTLLGKQIINEGVISAQLGSVNLAAGKAAVLTFDNQGLLGVKITKAVLQDELGVDPAILNSGEINSESGRVLLTASVSQDIFSQAVNSDGIEQATSVVVNDDGTFTLGSGADVVNTGSINVSSEQDNADAGQVVILGENITSSGSINADASNANAGEIELHSNNTTLLTENSITSARAENTGKGGFIKLLGDRVGLLDQSSVDASGATGGGEVLIGGDYRGKNNKIRNASGTYIGRDAVINATAISNGDGGRVIIWGNDSARVFGSLFAQGGSLSGNGGFIETSAGYVELDPNVKVGAINGEVGTWLIDPFSITIQSSCGGCTETLEDDIAVGGFDTVFTPAAADSILTTGTLESSFIDGANILVQTTAGGTTEALGGGDITVASEINLNDAPGLGTYSLTLQAHNDININSRIYDSSTNSSESLNLTLIANSNNDLVDGGDVNINQDIFTYGGSFSASGNNINVANPNGRINTQGGSTTLTANNSGTVTVNGSINTLGGIFTANGTNYTSGSSSSLITRGGAAANFNMTGTVRVDGIVDTGLGIYDANGTTFNGTGSTITANAVDLNGITGAITLGGVTAATITANSASSIIQSVADNGLNISGTSTFASSGLITLNDSQNDFGGAVVLSNSGANNVIVTDTDNIQLGAINVGTGTLTVNAVGISQSDTITQAAGAGQATFNGGDGSIILTQNNNLTGNVSLNNINSNNVRLTNNGAVSLATSNVGSGILRVNASSGISQVGAITQEADAGATTFDVGAGFINLSSANDFTGAVSLINSGANIVNITDANSIELGTSNVGSGLFLVNASSGITQSGAITQDAGASIAQFSAGAGVIDLTQANDFTGSVNLINSGNNAIDITDQNSLSLGTSSVGTGTLTVNAVGITQNGGITQAAGADLATFDANAGQLILNQANNFTGDVSLNNSGANNVAITDTNAIQFATSGIGSGTFDVNSVGVTQSGAITQETGAGITTINAGAAAIDLSQANEFTGSVRLNNSGANAVAITDISNILLGTSNLGTGTLTVDAIGISQDGIITQAAAAGLASFDANAGAINLTQNNTFTGNVALFNTGANNVAITDTGPMQLAASNIGSGTLSVNATGAITQSGALIQEAAAGATVFNAGTGAITLTQANDFTGAVSLNNTGLNAVSVTDQNAIELAASNVGSGTLTVNAVGITQSGAIVQEAVAGLATFNSGAGVINLSELNNFTGEVALNNTGANLVSIRDIDLLRFASANIGSGTFSINATGISQSNAIIQEANAGAVNINGNAGSITFTNASNDFTGSVSLNNTGNNSTYLRDTNSIELGNSNVGGYLQVVAYNASDITQSDAIAVGGNSDFYVAAGQSIQLNNAANNFQGGISFIPLGGTQLANVSIANSGTLSLGNINVSNDLIVSAAGISDSGVLSVGGTAWFEAGVNSIVLDNATSDFNDVVFNNASSVSIADLNDINVGSTDAAPGGIFTTTNSTITGALSINAAGGITDTDTSILTVGGVSTLNAGANNIVLDATTNDFSVVNVTNAQDVTLVDANSIDLLSTAINGNLDVTATTGGILNTTGALNVTGTSSFVAADNNSVLLTNAGNRLNGAISVASIGPGNLLDATITNSVLTDILSLNVLNNLIVNSTNGLTQSGLITVGNDTTINTGNQDAVLNLANNLNTLNITNAGNATINNGTNALLVNGASASGTVNLSSNGMTIAGAVAGATGTNLDSTSGVMQINADIQTSSGTLQVSGSQVNLDASLNSNNGDTNVSSSQGIVMATNSSITAANGNIQLNAVDNIDLTSLVASSNTATVNTTSGAIIDANADSTNMTASNVILHAATGIGVTANSIETVTSSLDVVNSTSGEVVINNTGEVNLIALKNLGSSGDITIENDGSYLINPGSVDAGYDTGALIMRSTGSYLGQGAQPPFTNADITARTGTFFGFAGTFGTTQRPLVLNIRDSALIQTRASLNPQFAEPRPIVNDESLLQFSGLDTLSAISGEQLVEVETLAEVDPAIFTDLQNFSMQEISIRMPRDQLFEDELEEYDRAR